MINVVWAIPKALTLGKFVFDVYVSMLCFISVNGLILKRGLVVRSV